MPVASTSKHGRSFILTVLGMLLASQGRAQEGEVTVRLVSGRVLGGLVDERSSDETLWLRTQRKTSYLRRPVAWSQVDTVQAGEERLTKAQTLSRATPAPPDQPRPPRPPAQHIASYRPTIHPPRSLAIRAEVGNWDRDADPDGLLLWLRPENSQGEVTPVAGQVEIECWGLERRHGKPGGELTYIERWSRPITLADFAASGALLELPYGAINPLEQLSFNPYGLVRVRLSIPGGGTLDALLDGVRLKPATPVQDWQRVSELFPH